MVDLKSIEEKWKKIWEENKVFESDASLGKKKFFATFPYPYMNGFLHMGHFYSVMRAEVFSRYKRLQGHNVLFPQAWHCTGSPIEAAAKRVREKESKQIESMKKQGFSDKEIEKFGEAKHWTEFFPARAKEDYLNLGMSVDFRRSFITTSLNPYYDKFIEWQFNKLKGKYVVKGKHPVVWDPKENTPVGDHDRVEGEGEIPQEFLLIKHKLEDGRLIVTATLRPDTLLGITNLYVNPDVTYKEVEVKNEKWIVSENCIANLESQGFNPKVRGDVSGKSLIAKKVEVVGNRKVLCLPASFVDEKYGTGLVHSVPSDSVDDLIALWDLQKDEQTLKKYGFNVEEVNAIKPIPVLNTPGYGENPAEVMLREEGIKSQKESKKLEKIRNELYKISFYNATFNSLYQNYFSENLEGKNVQDHKELIKDELEKQGFSDKYYQLTGKVVARSLSECVVKIVEDQWFMNYSDKEWKKLAHECLDSMKLYPDKSRQQFNYVLDWLQNWACVREVGLGTKLPWDDKWVIESLSDSTIYMAYYTIAHLLQEEDLNEIDDSVFDHIFLGKEKPTKKLKHLDTMKEEFNYWYPMDFRNSGKDLIQNHLAFSIFNHVAIFPKDKWPRSFGVNGWVTVDGQKMSKSLGNFIMLKDLVKESSVDGSRITIMSGGEGLDDPNWDSDTAKSMENKLNGLYELCADNYDKGSSKVTNADKWMESQLNCIIKNCTEFMEQTLFRSALQKSFFELPKTIKNYIAKSDNNPNKEIMNKAIESLIILNTPFSPFICEEVWEKLGNQGYVTNASWPEFDESKIDLKANFFDDMIANTKKDISTVKELSKKEKLSKVILFVSEEWKYNLVDLTREKLKETRNTGDIIKAVMGTDLRKQGKEISKLIPRLVKNASMIPNVKITKNDELNALQESLKKYKEEFGCDVKIIDAEDSKEAKARQSIPGKPAILVD
ncbi:leucine--tRNA ligase [Candidatus Woesearchaeota archaeon]|nr:leucine--tRNA ligase [Candidatus Woesearchaeota archaeon]